MPPVRGQTMTARVGPVGYRGPGAVSGSVIGLLSDVQQPLDDQTTGPAPFLSPQLQSFAQGTVRAVSRQIPPQPAPQTITASIGVVRPNGGVLIPGQTLRASIVGPGQTAAGAIPVSGQTLTATQGSVAATVTLPVSIWDTSLTPSFASGLLLRRFIAGYDVDTDRRRGSSTGQLVPVPFSDSLRNRIRDAAIRGETSFGRAPLYVQEVGGEIRGVRFPVDALPPDTAPWYVSYTILEDGTTLQTIGTYNVRTGERGFHETVAEYRPPSGATAANVTSYRFEQLGEMILSATVRSTQLAPPAPGTRLSGAKFANSNDVRLLWRGPNFAGGVAPAVVVRATTPTGTVSTLVLRSTDSRATLRTHDLPNREYRWFYGSAPSPLFSFVRNRATSRFDIAVVNAADPSVNLTDFTISI